MDLNYPAPSADSSPCGCSVADDELHPLTKAQFLGLVFLAAAQLIVWGQQV